MPNETCESLVREICVHSSELVTFVQSHSKEANQLSLCIEIAPRTMRDVMGEDDLIWWTVESRKLGDCVTCLPGSLPPRGLSRKNMGWPP